MPNICRRWGVTSEIRWHIGGQIKLRLQKYWTDIWQNSYTNLDLGNHRQGLLDNCTKKCKSFDSNWVQSIRASFKRKKIMQRTCHIKRFHTSLLSNNYDL